MKPTVFIQTNEKQFLGAKVSEYSLKKASENSDQFDVKIIKLEDYPHLFKCEGQPYLREGRTAIWRNDNLQSFPPLRFLPPQLMGYQGRAVVVDPDVFAVADVYELLTRDMKGKAILCWRMRSSGDLQHASSVMLLDCRKLMHWKWEEAIDEMFAFKRDYLEWMWLLLEPEDTIGPLEKEWNHFDTLNENTKLLHTTERITQPWKTGLPIDFVIEFTPESQGMLGAAVRQIKSFLRTSLRGRPKYLKHPDPRQEKFFFSFVNELLEQGVLTKGFLESEIEKKHIRPDAFDVLASLASKGS